MTKTYQHYRVTADRETGEWIDTPKLIGTVDAHEWLTTKVNIADTDAIHYDTWPVSDDDDAAIEVHWA